MMSKTYSTPRLLSTWTNLTICSNPAVSTCSLPEVANPLQLLTDRRCVHASTKLLVSYLVGTVSATSSTLRLTSHLLTITHCTTSWKAFLQLLQISQFQRKVSGRRFPFLKRLYPPAASLINVCPP